MLKKMMDKVKWAGLCCVAAFVLFSFTWPQSNFLSEAEKKGRQIFTEGTSPDGGEVFALMSGIKVPAAVMACATCHGKNGKGVEEGGVSPSDITWTALTTNYEGKRPTGRTHPPYDEKLLKRAITMGFDPAGNQLNATMPKYQMSHEDLSNLVAYIKVLGMETVAGVEDHLLHIGMFPSPNLGARDLHQVTEQAITAYFSEINNNGGIYGRQLKLHLPTKEQMVAEKAGTFLNTQPLFALVNSFYSNPISQNKNAPEVMPTIGAFDPFPIKDFSRNNHLFYLYPGLDGMAEGLAVYANESFDKTALTVLYQAEGIRGQLAKTLEKKFGNDVDMIPVSTTNELPALVESFRSSKKKLIVLLPPQLERDLMDHFSKMNWAPDLFLVGSLISFDPTSLPPLFNGKVFLAYPSWITSASQKGNDYYRFLKEKYQLPDRYRQSQLAALTSAMLLVKGLENTGRKLTRYSLIGHLEKMYGFETGLLPSLTFGPNRRIGSDLVFITKVQAIEPRLTLVKEIKVNVSE